MNIRPSKRLEQLTSAIFTDMARLKKAVVARGVDVIDLGIGSPDRPPAPEIIEAMQKAVTDPRNYGYPTTDGTADFRQTVADWYRYRFNTEVDPASEVLSLMGSQDGLAHLAQALTDPGDIVLVPDPGYPIYAASVLLAGADLYKMPLTADNGFLPDFTQIPLDIARRAKLMILNYPSNPVSAVADLSFFNQVIEFARKHEIIVAHDLAYSEMAFDQYLPPSFLQAEGASEVGVEFNSLSKSFNMAGCRIAYMVGNSEVIQALAVVKSNIDYGVFLAVQEAAVAAMKLDMKQKFEERQTVASIYQSRRDVLIDGLAEIGWHIDKPKATMFVWARIPQGWTSNDFSKALLEKVGVVVIPGDAFGDQGEGYVRIALVREETVLKEVIRRIDECGILQ